MRSLNSFLPLLALIASSLAVEENDDSCIISLNLLEEVTKNANDNLENCVGPKFNVVRDDLHSFSEKTTARFDSLETNLNDTRDRIKVLELNTNEILTLLKNLAQNAGNSQNQCQGSKITSTDISDLKSFLTAELKSCGTPKIEQKGNNCESSSGLNLTRLKFGAYYFSTNKNLNRRGAASFCQENGMQLATFENLSDMEQVKTAAPQYEFIWDFWVSASDIGQRPGHFAWADGRKVDDAFWFSLDAAQKQPDDAGYGKETCAILSSKSGDLWDFPCDEQKLFICKAPKENLHCAN